ncbi:hypothetical protein IW150_003493 [Coemansia sp. RSA 2607]|nr:hypothetical protein IW150_003493 [Coemansia sp. RSA 2607]
MVVAIEHRFFGQSNPLPDLSTTSLAYMTLDNSLEDFAQFIRALKQTPQTIFPSVSGTPVNSTVVFTGGSYGGSIAAWMRAKYPDLVSAAWASSAPVFSFNSFYQLDQAFGQHLGERGCNETFAQAVAELDEIIMSTNTTAIDEVKVKFGLPGLANDDFVTQLANIVSSSINTPVTVNNDMIDRSICSFFNGMRAPLDSYVLAVSAIINGYTPPSRVSTFNAPSRYLIQKRDNNVDVSVNQAYRSWNYISCTWFADWQVPAPSSLNLTSYRSQLITSEYWESGCTESFGSSLALPVNVSAHNEKWLSILKNTTKIFFTVGSIDPWRGSTVAPESGYIVQGSDTVVITVMNGATHTQDMQMQSKYDLSEVTTAREMGDRLIMEWIQ